MQRQFLVFFQFTNLYVLLSFVNVQGYPKNVENPEVVINICNWI